MLLNAYRRQKEGYKKVNVYLDSELLKNCSFKQHLERMAALKSVPDPELQNLILCVY